MSLHKLLPLLSALTLTTSGFAEEPFLYTTCEHSLTPKPVILPPALFNRIRADDWHPVLGQRYDQAYPWPDNHLMDNAEVVEGRRREAIDYLRAMGLFRHLNRTGIPIQIDAKYRKDGFNLIPIRTKGHVSEIVPFEIGGQRMHTMKFKRADTGETVLIELRWVRHIKLESEGTSFQKLRELVSHPNNPITLSFLKTGKYEWGPRDYKDYADLQDFLFSLAESERPVRITSREAGRDVIREGVLRYSANYVDNPSILEDKFIKDPASVSAYRLLEENSFRKYKNDPTAIPTTLGKYVIEAVKDRDFIFDYSSNIRKIELLID